MVQYNGQPYKMSLAAPDPKSEPGSAFNGSPLNTLFVVGAILMAGTFVVALAQAFGKGD